MARESSSGAVAIALGAEASSAPTNARSDRELIATSTRAIRAPFHRGAMSAQARVAMSKSAARSVMAAASICASMRARRRPMSAHAPSRPRSAAGVTPARRSS